MPYDQKVTVVLSSGIPVGIPSSGSVGANGAVTITTALNLTYPNIYLHFPVGAVYANSPDGFYFCQMTSTTLGTVFNNLYTTGTPVIPAVLNPVVGAGPGAYTQATTLQQAISVTLPGGSMGNNGSLTYDLTGSHLNSAGNKTYSLPWGAGNILSVAVTTTAAITTTRTVTNAGLQNAQTTGPFGTVTGGGSPGLVQQFSADTSVNTTIGCTLQIAVATDYMILQSLRIVSYFA
jgi:hypothetical protein